MNPYIIAASCAHCTPWVRFWRSPVTGVELRQELHEDHCPTFPHLTRTDVEALCGD